MSWIPVPGENAVYTQTAIPQTALEGLPHKRGENVIVMRHDYWTTIKARQRGIILPSPTVHYPFPGRFDPWWHQRHGVEFLTSHPRCACLLPLRAGKTHTAAWSFDFLRAQGVVKRALIIAPLSICSHVWERELFIDFPHLRTAVLTGSRDRKRRIAEDDRIDVCIVNPESVHLLEKQYFDIIIVDEATAFKDPKTRRWKALNKLSDKKWLWLLTATPTPQSPLDAYGLIRLIRPKYLSYLQWRDLTMKQVTRFKWVPLQDADKTVAAWLQPAIRIRREDCYDMPDTQYEYEEFDLSKEQKQLIESLQDEARAELEGQVITAANAAAVFSKLMQAECGGVYGYDERGDRKAYFVPAKDYFDTLSRIVEQADTPVLIFAPFRAAVAAIDKAMNEAGYRTGTITGEVKARDRSPLFDSFKRGELDVLIAIPSTMSHGLDLSNSRFVVWAGPPTRAETYEQANGRVMGSRQKREMVFLHLFSTPLAKEGYNRLKSKARLQDSILNLIGGLENAS